MVRLEVETKIKVNPKNVNELRERIKKIARFRNKTNKYDSYFAIKINGYPKKAFRIRDDGKKLVVNFKKWLKNYWTKDIVVKEEYEFTINNKDIFLALMKDLGFREWMEKIKKSESYIYKKNTKVNIEINEVKNLGYFIEIEYIARKEEVKKAMYTIRSILKELGIKSNEINNKGYTKMLWKKRNNRR